MTFPRGNHLERLLFQISPKTGPPDGVIVDSQQMPKNGVRSPVQVTRQNVAGLAAGAILPTTHALFGPLDRGSFGERALGCWHATKEENARCDLGSSATPGGEGRVAPPLLTVESGGERRHGHRPSNKTGQEGW